MELGFFTSFQYIFLFRSDKTFEQIMEERMAKDGRSWKNLRSGRKDSASSSEQEAKKKAAPPLDGVNVFVAKKLQSAQDEIFDIVTSLGGSVSCNYTAETVTHVVFTGKANDITKEFRNG
jgi:hypothetical protein